MEEFRQESREPRWMRVARNLSRGTLGVAGIAGLGSALLLAGCETGRTNKAHAEWQHLSDDTTTGKSESKQALGPGDHQPPVPGSPTAAGADGNQPADDMQARSREHGEPASPHARPAESH